jgi:hypothetical protein
LNKSPGTRTKDLLPQWSPDSNGVQLWVVEYTNQVVHLMLPAKLREGHLSDAELAGVAGGFPAFVASF